MDTYYSDENGFIFVIKKVEENNFFSKAKRCINGKRIYQYSIILGNNKFWPDSTKSTGHTSDKKTIAVIEGTRLCTRLLVKPQINQFAKIIRARNAVAVTLINYHT